MSTLANERVAWFNGKIVPEHEVLIPLRDSIWLYGDGAFDMTRSFGGKPFKLKEHMERFYRSLKYLRIDPGMNAEKMIAISEDVFERTRHLLGPDEDYWIGQRVSRGVKDVPGDNLDYHGPNIVVECMPLPFASVRELFIEGIKVMVPSHRRTPPESLTPRAKTHNYLNLIVANQEIHAIDPSHGRFCSMSTAISARASAPASSSSGTGKSRPHAKSTVLPGVSRQTAIDLAREARLTVTEADLDLYDAYNADEIFITSTSLCLCPAVSVNGVHVGPAGQVWGPITKKLVDAYIRFVNFDFVAQYCVLNLPRRAGGSAAVRPARGQKDRLAKELAVRCFADYLASWLRAPRDPDRQSCLPAIAWSEKDCDVW